MNAIALTREFRPRLWEVRSIWPADDPEDASATCPCCGSRTRSNPEALTGSLSFCTSCEERSHLGDFPEIYAELGGEG
jgi:hypothetical protein